MRIIVNGSNGRMGKEVVKLLLDGVRGCTLAAAVDINPPASASYPTFSSLEDVNVDADCLVDFSHHAAALAVANFAVSSGIPAVIATTGQTEEELKYIKKAAESVPVFYSANMSLGVALLAELARLTAKTMPDADIEIIETHHNRKLDAPSGTALLLANEIKKVRESADFVYGRQGQQKRNKGEIGIHAVRMGNIVGIHEIRVGTDTQTITLKHEAHSRALFAEGALAAAEFLQDKPCGMYNMNDMVKS